MSTPYVPLYGSNSYQPGLKTFEKKADPEKLKKADRSGGEGSRITIVSS